MALSTRRPATFFRFRSLLLVVGALVAGPLGCADGDARDLKLDVAAPDAVESVEDEDEFLRRQQLIRRKSVSSTGVVTYADDDPEDVEQVIADYCDELIYCNDEWDCDPNDCHELWAGALQDTCAAKTLLALSKAQAVPVSVKVGTVTYSWEGVTEAAAAGLATLAAKNASAAAMSLIDEIVTANTAPAPCRTGSLWKVEENFGTNESMGTLLASAIGSAYHIGVASFERAVEATVNTADKLRSSTTSSQEATSRSITGTALSRAAAAHLLVGGDPGVLGATEVPFCSGPELSAGGVAALRLFRDAGLQASMLSGGLWRDLLKSRLSQYYENPQLAAAPSVAAFYNLEDADLIEANKYLRGEIDAFMRSTHAQLAPDASGGSLLRYVATATEPTPLPEGAWAAVAAHSETVGLWSPTQNLNLRTFIGAVHSGIRRIIGSSDTFAAANSDPTATRTEVVAGLGTIISSGEYQGAISTQQIGTSFTAWAHGYLTSDRVRVVVGEAGLRCALEGTIEGAACGDATLTGAQYPCSGSNAGSANKTLACLTVASVSTETSDVGGFTGMDRVVSTTRTGVTIPSKTRLYFVVPRTAASPEKPGHFRLLAGTTALQGTQRNYVPISPTVDAQVDKVLAPDPKHCARSETDCTGIKATDPLPLEDELSDDNDGIETSWKHYVGLARQAADEADLYGREYVSYALSKLSTEAQDEIRKEEQLQQAESQMQVVQEICGTAIDLRPLVDVVSGGLDKDLEHIYYVPPQPCSTAFPCSDGYACVSGTCFLKLDKITQQFSTYPDAQRLARCLSADEVPFVTLGSAPLCVLTDATDTGIVCPPAAGVECPQTLPTSGTCPEPSGFESFVAEPLGYFSAAGGAVQLQNTCSALRRARTRALSHSPVISWTDADRAAQQADLDLVRRSNLFLPANLKKFIGKVMWSAKYGGYAAVTEDGVTRLSTGELSTGPTGGPCAATPPAGCTMGSTPVQGLFCDTINCSNTTARGAFNYRMFRAVAAANLILGSGHDKSGTRGNLVVLPSTADFGEDPCSGNFFMYNPPGVEPAFTPELVWALKKTSVFESGGVTPIRVCNAIPSSSVVRGDVPKEGFQSYERQAGSGVAWILENGNLINSGVGVKFGTTAGRAKLSGLSDAERENVLLGGLFELESGDPSLQWTRAVLEGSRNIQNFGRSYPEVAIAAPWGGISPSAYYVSESTPLPGVALLDGLELVCELAADRGVAQSEPTAVQQSLETAGAYIENVAEKIHAAASSAIFARVPKIAMDALREASPTGAFPTLGGRLAESMSGLRGALLASREALPALSGAVFQLGSEMRAYGIKQDIKEAQDDLIALSLASTVADRLTACADSATNLAKNFSSFGGHVAINCANAAAQIAIAFESAAGQRSINNDELKLERELLLQRLNGISLNLESAGTALRESFERIDASLASVEGLRKQAQVAVASALHKASYQSEKQVAYLSGVGVVADAYQERYTRALVNAKRMAYLARRAVEQRLGVRLSDMREDLPLVEAPQSWEGNLCSMTAIPSSSDEGANTTETPDLSVYVNGFVGDYVTKLENLVESYRIAYNFHEGDDIVVLSLRDDVFRERAPCQVPGKNLFAQAASLDAGPWQATGCTPVTVNGTVHDAFNCISVVPTNETVLDGLADPKAAAMGFKLQLGDGRLCGPTPANGTPTGGCGWNTNVAWAQKLNLEQGRYRLTWHTRSTVAANLVQKVRRVETGTLYNIGPGPTVVPDSQVGAWSRRYIEYSIPAAGEYEVGFGLTSATSTPPSTEVTIAAPMLERLADDGSILPFSDFQQTDENALVTATVCEDETGDQFRANHWKRGCVRLCPTGYSNDCKTGREYCYNETSFGISQRAIDSGDVFAFSGFARGNFNYRIDQVALNFVGAAVRDCSESDNPSTCYSAAYVPYSMEHNGPFLVRNHEGKDTRAYLFDGRIEQARGLGAERYLTNPLSGTDRELLTDYFRKELRGRPLDGTFVIRVWDDEGVDFNSIQDVQLLLRYRYWTHND